MQLAIILAQIPADQINNVNDGDTIDETWGSAIALENYDPPAAENLLVSETNLTRYKQDLLAKAKSIISASSETQNVQVSPEMVVEKVSVFDLDNNGSLEIFGSVRKGADLLNSTEGRSPTGEPPPNIHANIWLTYCGEQPQVVNSKVRLNTLGSSGAPYEVLSAVDVNGDSVQEIIVRNVNYEALSFSIYEYKSNLEEVFNGTGYGC